MLSIRFSRRGKKSQPTYRLIISEKEKDPWGRCLEILGYYTPKVGSKIFNLKEDRLKYWLGKGAKLSATVNNLLVSQGVISTPKVKVARAKKAAAAATAAAKPEPAKPAEAVPAKTEEPKKEESKVEAPAEAPKS